MHKLAGGLWAWAEGARTHPERESQSRGQAQLRWQSAHRHGIALRSDGKTKPGTLSWYLGDAIEGGDIHVVSQCLAVWQPDNTHL